MVDFIEVLKWVGVVFLAGFIGYFGKYLGKMILPTTNKSKKKETERKSDKLNKLEKKRLKAEIKQKKK